MEAYMSTFCGLDIMTSDGEPDLQRPIRVSLPQSQSRLISQHELYGLGGPPCHCLARFLSAWISMDSMTHYNSPHCGAPSRGLPSRYPRLRTPMAECARRCHS